MNLKERNDRKGSQNQVPRDVRSRRKRGPGITVSIEDVGEVGSSIKPLLVNVRGEDIGLLKNYSAQLKQEMYGIPGIVDIEATLEQDIPEYSLSVDREKAVNSGIMTDHIVRTVGVLVGGEAVSTYEDEDGEAVDVRVRLPENQRRDPSQVQNLRLAVQKGSNLSGLMPIGNIAAYDVSDSPSEINRQALSRRGGGSA